MVQSARNSNLSEILCMSLLPASIKRIGSKPTEKRWRHNFPHCKSMRAFCCHGNQSFDPICPKTLCSLSPTPVMLKFDQDWPTGLRDIQVRKCKIFVIQGQVTNSIVSGPIWPKFELVQDFMHDLVTCKYKEDRIKSNREKVETPFSLL